MRSSLPAPSSYAPVYCHAVSLPFLLLLAYIALVFIPQHRYLYVRLLQEISQTFQLTNFNRFPRISHMLAHIIEVVHITDSVVF